MDENESRHCIKVLRMAKGNMIDLVDGRGNLYQGMISIPDPACCEITITSTIRDFEKRDYRLHIAISPIKNPERFEWFVEKSVEIGIDEITPLICRNTEKPGIKSERLNNIIVSAMKQSVKAFRPVLNKPADFAEFINVNHPEIKMIAHCCQAPVRKKLDQVYSKGSDALIMIGPEGDFSMDEINLSLEKGFQSVHLGSSRLRTETAGIAACHTVYFINQ